jgi:hypothetical protein
MPAAFVLRVLSALLIAFGFGSTDVLACSCREVTPFCNILASAPDSRGGAVFIGRVIEVFPREKETLQSLLAHVPELVPSDDLPLSLDQQKQLRLRLAKGLLTAAEQRRISEAKDEAELWNIEFRWWRTRRVRMEVLEAFWGLQVNRVELSTPMDDGACGIAFAEGREYLVDAGRNPRTGQLLAALCSRTSEVVGARDDIDALRAWQRGCPLPHRVWGWLARKGGDRPQPPVANLRLFLRGGASTYETLSDEGGRFRFADVAPDQYRMEADAPGYELKWRPLFGRGNDNSTIDLETSRCAELVVSFDHLAP